VQVSREQIIVSEKSIATLSEEEALRGAAARLSSRSRRTRVISVSASASSCI
jgi:hypothetical protein